MITRIVEPFTHPLSCGPSLSGTVEVAVVEYMPTVAYAEGLGPLGPSTASAALG